MTLKEALIEVAMEKGFVTKDDASVVYTEIQILTVSEVAAKVNINPVTLDDPGLLNAMDQAISDNPKAVADYLAGKEKSINRIMGQIMKITGGRNDAGPLLEMLKERIKVLQS